MKQSPQLSAEEAIALLVENKKLKKTNAILTIFLFLVFIAQFIANWSDLFR